MLKDKIDINELRKRGYEDESIALMMCEEFEKDFVPEPPDYDEVITTLTR